MLHRNDNDTHQRLQQEESKEDYGDYHTTIELPINDIKHQQESTADLLLPGRLAGRLLQDRYAKSPKLREMLLDPPPYKVKLSSLDYQNDDSDKSSNSGGSCCYTTKSMEILEKTDGETSIRPEIKPARRRGKRRSIDTATC